VSAVRRLWPLVAFLVGALGSAGVGLVLREPLQMGIAMVFLGGIVGLIAGERSSGAALATGIVVSLPVLILLDLLTPLRTILNIQSGLVAGAIVVFVIYWVGFIVAALAGFGVMSLIGRRFLL
jgi:hypothetical protein